MEALRELLAKFTIEVEGAEKLEDTNKGLDDGADSALDFSAALKVAGAAIAALGLGALVSKTWDFVEAATSAVDETGKLSTTLQISTESIQQWGHIATTSGGSISDVAASMRRLSKGMFDASRAAGPAREAFEKLGVSVADDDGNLRSLEDVMFDTAVAIGGVENNADKLSLAQETIGRGALKLIPGFKGTREEMRATLDQMSELAGVFDEDFIRASEGANDELHFMRNQWEVLKSVIVGALLPAFRWVVTGISSIVGAIQKFLKQTGLIDRWLKIGSFASFGGLMKLIAANWGLIVAVAIKFFAVLRPFVLVIAKFLAFALILDDIVTFLMGGDSALGRLLDKIFGAGTAEAVLESIRQGFENIKIFIGFVSLGLEALWEDFKVVLAAVGEGFEILLGGARGLGTFLLELGDTIFGDFADSAIGAIKDVITWIGNLLKKFSGLEAAQEGIAKLAKKLGGGLFEAEDAKLNAQAAAEAAARQKASPSPARAPGGTKTASINDSSRVEVNLNSPQTPATVREATGAAFAIKSAGSKGAQNALVRGYYE